MDGKTPTFPFGNGRKKTSAHTSPTTKYFPIFITTIPGTMPRTKIDIESRFALKVLVVLSKDYQGALDYFGFEGKYNPDIKSKRYQSEDYWGATNRKTGEISYGNLAFEDYSTLYGIYIKESYHARKIQSGLSIEKLPSDLQGLGMDTYLEEIHGYVHAYKRQGLFSGHNMPFSGIEFYQSHLGMFVVPYPTYPSRFSWIYKVPRRW